MIIWTDDTGEFWEQTSQDRVGDALVVTLKPTEEVPMYLREVEEARSELTAQLKEAAEMFFGKEIR